MSDVIQVVFKKGVLFDITIGRWSALHQMKTNDLLLEKLNRRIIYPGHKKLLPDDAAQPIATLEGKIRSFVRKHSMQFPISGAVFVTFKALPDLLKGLKQLKTEYETAAQALVTNWDKFKADQIKALDEEARKVAVQNGLYENNTPMADKETLKNWLKTQHSQHVDLYPPKDQLLAKYYVSWTMFKVGQLDQTAAEEFQEAAADFFQEQQEKLKQSMIIWVKEKAVEMHKKLGEAAANAKALLAENGKLNPKNLKPLFAAFEEFKSIDFAGSSFAPVIEGIEKKFLVGANGVDFEDVATAVNGSADEFSNLLSSMADLAVEEVAAKAGAVSLANSDFKRIVEV